MSSSTVQAACDRPAARSHLSTVRLLALLALIALSLPIRSASATPTSTVTSLDAPSNRSGVAGVQVVVGVTARDIEGTGVGRLTVVGAITTGPNLGDALSCATGTDTTTPADAPPGATACATDTNGVAYFRYTSTGSAVDRWTFHSGPATSTTAVTWDPPDPGRHVALGDSYSSGEGAGAYSIDTNTKTNTCHRSAVAWPGQLSSQVPTWRAMKSRTFKACSGAVTEDFMIKNTNQKGEDAQYKAVTSSTRVVTYTLGGNDVGFPQILEACAYVTIADGAFGSKGRPGCSRPSDWRKRYFDRAAALKDGKVLSASGKKINTVAQIAEKIAARTTDADVYVVGYPQLFGDVPDSSLSYCRIGTLKLGPASFDIKIRNDDAVWLNRLANKIDGTIAAAVNAWKPVDPSRNVRLHYVNPNSSFSNHRRCDKANSWINPVVLDSHRKPQPSSMHPSADGQAAYSKAVAAVMKQSQPPEITSLVLPRATAGSPYTTSLTAVPSNLGNWKIIGSLPGGLRLVGNTISGTSNKVGSTSFTVELTDVKGVTARVALRLTTLPADRTVLTDTAAYTRAGGLLQAGLSYTAVSDDSRWVAFVGDYGAWEGTQPTDGATDVVLLTDIVQHKTTAVSQVATPPGTSPNQQVGIPTDVALSADGRFLTWQQTVPLTDAQFGGSTYHRFDRLSGDSSTILGMNGEPLISRNANSGSTALSPDGNIYTFTPGYSGEGAIQGLPDSSSMDRLAQINMTTGVVRAVSMNDDDELAQWNSFPVAQADDGRLAFITDSPNMMPDHFWGYRLYIRDPDQGTTEVTSLGPTDRNGPMISRNLRWGAYGGNPVRRVDLRSGETSEIATTPALGLGFLIPDETGRTFQGDVEVGNNANAGVHVDISGNVTYLTPWISSSSSSGSQYLRATAGGALWLDETQTLKLSRLSS